MKYFIDTEFIEGFHKPFLGKKRHFIDLISIGLVDESGREYYGISMDFDIKDANAWVNKNVLSQLPSKYASWPDDSPRMHKEAAYWKSNTVIRKEILNFFGCVSDGKNWKAPDGIEVYGYYSDYDWVLFCSLFGTMMDLPIGFPMFCIDLKQMMWERGLTKEWKETCCPDPENEHHALEDAKWNKNLYNAIITKL